MERRVHTAALTRALWLLLIAALSAGSDCTSCTVPNPNYRQRDAAVDGPVDAQPAPHYHYLFNKILVPTNQTQKDQYSLDLNGDGTVDNSIGGALVAIAGLGFDLQAAVDKDGLAGDVIMLADVQTPDFRNAETAGIRLYLGDKPQPAPCNDATDVVKCTDAKPTVCTGCGHHLANGTFSIAATAPKYPAITGKVIDGTFAGGPGEITLMLSLGDGAPIRFDLIGAKIKASGMSEANIGSVAGSIVTDGLVLAGAVTQENFNNTIIPGIRAQLNTTVTAECTGAPPTCGCPDTDSGRTAKSLLDFLNLEPKDCAISVAEVQAKASLLFRQDVTIDGKPAYSIGVKAAATKATFSVP